MRQHVKEGFTNLSYFWFCCFLPFFQAGPLPGTGWPGRAGGNLCCGDIPNLSFYTCSTKYNLLNFVKDKTYRNLRSFCGRVLCPASPPSFLRYLLPHSPHSVQQMYKVEIIWFFVIMTQCHRPSMTSSLVPSSAEPGASLGVCLGPPLLPPDGQIPV